MQQSQVSTLLPQLITDFELPDPTSKTEQIAEIGRILSQLNQAVGQLELGDVPRLYDAIDFYSEVQLFEANLIKAALKASGGSQIKAAKLLNLKATTLSHKIKSLKIPTFRR